MGIRFHGNRSIPNPHPCWSCGKVHNLALSVFPLRYALNTGEVGSVLDSCYGFEINASAHWRLCLLFQTAEHSHQNPANTTAGTEESLEVEEYQHVISSQLPDRSRGCFMLLPSASDDGGPDLLLLPAHPHSCNRVHRYFIHDFLDMALNQPFKQSWDLLLHHSLVISCFSLAATSRLYLGFAVVSLLIEINSVFLHLRQLLLLLSGWRNRPGTELTAPQPSLAYSITSWLNLGT